MKTLLKNGKIYDGTGKDAFIGDVLYEDDRILSVSGRIADTDADRVVDLNGLALAPGFIDAHSHNDWFAIKQEPVKYFEPFIRQGITTFVTGNCGLSAIGFDADTPYVDKIGGGLFHFNDTTGKYGSAEAFFSAIDANTPCNIAALVGHCSARASVMGYDGAKITQKQEERMLSILEENLRQGACGVSLGLMYEPGIYADVEELKRVAALCIKYDKPLTVHPRANSAVSLAYPEILGRSHLLRAVDELCEVAKGTKLKLQYSHAIFVGRKSLRDEPEFLKIMHGLRDAGVDIGFDIYHELLGVSVITVILPAWYQGMSVEERKKPFIKAKLSLLIKASSQLLGFGFQDMVVAYVGEGLSQYEGKTVAEVAKMRGTSALDAYLYLCVVSDYKARLNMGPYTTEEIISELSREDMCLYMTDAWVEDNGIQNPAIYDCFPKFIRSSLLGTGDTMPRTIRKMTGQTADRFRLQDRGYIRAGAFADLTVFDESKMREATPDQPKSFGIMRVIINGKTVLEGESLCEESLSTSGKAVRC